MRGSDELARLADLFRIGARTARQIADLRPGDSGNIERLACAVEDMADQLDTIVSNERSGSRNGGKRANSMQ